jgi:hypothetical protein
MEGHMATDRPFVAENDAERERLRALVARLSDDDLQRPMPAGRTVATVLAHIGFWDARAIAVMEKWARGVAPSTADNEPEDVDWLNDATKPFFLALAPRDAARLTLQLAEDADRKIAEMSDDLLVQVVAAGTPFDLSRANHRREHLDDIEQVLGA